MQADVASALAALLTFAAACKYDLGKQDNCGKLLSQAQGPWLLAQAKSLHTAATSTIKLHAECVLGV